MAVRQIRIIGDEILNKKSYSEEWNKATVDDCYNEIKEIVEDFKEQEKQFTKIILERMGKNKILIVMSVITIIVLVCAQTNHQYSVVGIFLRFFKEKGMNYNGKI